MSEILITGGLVVSADQEAQLDVHIVDEQIRAVEPGLLKKLGSNFTGQIIDAKGCLVIPGGVDPHVHMELPLNQGSGATLTSIDDFETGTRAALFGGTTTILDFANQTKGGTLKQALDLWQTKARGKTYCDYGFHVSVTDFNESTRSEMAQCMDAGVTSFKTFTAYRDALMIDDRQMIEVMKEAKKLGGLVLVHAENGDMIADKVNEFKSHSAGPSARPKGSPILHALTHSRLAEAEAASRVVDLAKYTSCPIYLVHISTVDALERVQKATQSNWISGSGSTPVFVETCIQYLLLDASLYGESFAGAKFVLSPPLRGARDRTALWKGLAENSIEVLATDHCPFDPEQRELGRDDFSKIPSGIGGVEHRLELLYSEGVREGKVSLRQWVDLTSTRAAKIFGLYPKKGQIAPGADADLVIFDPEKEHVISAATHHSACKHSVYENRNVTGQCRTVFLRGKVALDGGALKATRGTGQYLKRNKFNAN